jgi:hypothetical protein
MRLERSHPWGFDHEDPRLDLRRAAAEAQRDTSTAEPAAANALTLHDKRSTGPEELEIGWGQRAVGPLEPAISRR